MDLPDAKKVSADEVLADIDGFVAAIAEHDDKCSWTDDEQKEYGRNRRAFLDSWVLLRHILSQGAPLPAEWAMAQQVQGPLGDLCEDASTVIGAALQFPEVPAQPEWRGAAARWREKWLAVLAGAVPGSDPVARSSADVQLEYLMKAADAVDALVSAIELDGDLADSEVGELHAKAAHLAGCVSSVDAMARENGDLPAAWLRPWIRALTPVLPVTGEVDTVTFQPAEHLFGTPIATVKLADERPPGFWGRIELPGMREYVGWIEEAERFGARGAVVRDWDGREINFVVPGPNAPVYHLPTPLRRPVSPPDTPEDPFGEGFGSGYREHDPY